MFSPCRFVEVWRYSHVLAPEVLDEYIAHTVQPEQRQEWMKDHEITMALFLAPHILLMSIPFIGESISAVQPAKLATSCRQCTASHDAGPMLSVINMLGFLMQGRSSLCLSKLRQPGWQTCCPRVRPQIQQPIFRCSNLAGLLWQMQTSQPPTLKHPPGLQHT